MNRKLAIAFAGIFMLTAAAAYGQEPNLSAASPGYVPGPGSGADSSPPSETQSPPLFTVDGLGVHVWTPVEPHYDSADNRDPAGEPLWGAE
jgi:hypothetical protein